MLNLFFNKLAADGSIVRYINARTMYFNKKHQVNIEVFNTDLRAKRSLLCAFCSDY